MGGSSVANEEEDSVARLGASLGAVDQALAGQARRQIVLWVIRWIIGFSLVAWVAHRWPTLWWLWPGAALIALASLTLSLTLLRRTKRRVDALSNTLARLSGAGMAGAGSDADPRVDDLRE